MKNILKKHIPVLFLSFMILLPVFSFAQSGNPIPTPAGVDITGGGGKTGITYECRRDNPNANPNDNNTKYIYGDCGYDDLIRAVQKFFDVVIPLALGFSVVVIAWVGFNYMISGTNPGKRKEANQMLQKVAIGIFFMLAAWLIVTLIANSLLSVSVNSLVPLKP